MRVLAAGVLSGFSVAAWVRFSSRPNLTFLKVSWRTGRMCDLFLQCSLPVGVATYYVGLTFCFFILLSCPIWKFLGFGRLHSVQGEAGKGGVLMMVMPSSVLFLLQSLDGANAGEIPLDFPEKVLVWFFQTATVLDLGVGCQLAWTVDRARPSLGWYVTFLPSLILRSWV